HLGRCGQELPQRLGGDDRRDDRDLGQCEGQPGIDWGTGPGRGSTLAGAVRNCRSGWGVTTDAMTGTSASAKASRASTGAPDRGGEGDMARAYLESRVGGC
ncbi:hypothetical protein AB4Z54_66175, partial [Streptomyces sp. MCAF7]